MKIRQTSLLLPYSKNLEILLQNRKKLKKKTSGDFGFFGGHLKEKENPYPALKREIKEELGINIQNLKIKFFKEFKFKLKKEILNQFVFLCKIPVSKLKKIKAKKGKETITNFQEVFKLDLSKTDKKILKNIKEYLMR